MYLPAINLTPHLLHHFQFRHNSLALTPFEKEVLVVPKNYLDIIFNEFIHRGINIIQKDRTTLKTEKTIIFLSPAFILKVISSNIDELLIVERSLTSLKRRHTLS